VAEYSVTGLTSNPTIFNRAIRDGTAYDADIADRKASGATDEQVFFDLALADLRRAAGLFAPVHARTDGVDGWVSLEVSPLLAHDTPHCRPDRVTGIVEHAVHGSHRFQGAIFDVDGVLVDSPHYRAWRGALQELMDTEWADVRGRTSHAPEKFTEAMYQQVVAGRPRLADARAALEYFGVPDAGRRADLDHLSSARHRTGMALHRHLASASVTRTHRSLFPDIWELGRDSRAVGCTTVPGTPRGSNGRAAVGRDGIVPGFLDDA
jgi:Transaldolase/Fructose-6-phosphate aldolase